MSRKSEEYLFELIKSLTRGEKRIFKQLANYSSSGKKKYLFLFEIIDTQNVYDEQVIKKKLKREKILTLLPDLKNYLQELILKSMRFYYSGKTIESKVREDISDIEFCQKKGLEKLRDKILVKSKHLAAEHEKHESSLLLLNKEMNFRSVLSRKDILVEQEVINKKMISILKYRHLTHSTFELLKKGEIRDESTKKKWEKIIKDPVMSEAAEPAGYEEFYAYHRIWMIYYSTTNDFKKSVHHSELILQNIESRPDWLVENMNMYISTLSDLVVARCLNKDTENAEYALNKLIHVQNWKLNRSDRYTLINLTCLAYGNLLEGFLKVNNFDRGLQLAMEAEKFININNVDHKYKSGLFFKLSVIYLYTKNYKAALKWNTAVLDGSDQNYIEDESAFARILNLIIHYELGNDELLPYFVRSTYRFLHKRKRLYKTEDAILRFIRNQLPKSNSRKETINFFKKLHLELRVITKHPFEAKALEYFDFISWLDSKTEGKSFAEVVMRKAKR
ncbi:MAG: hypothetical protein HYU69_05720 [Bacteroidetes bacterium]|nr:hypothetical protein [Bacteroidota bacterium]